MYMCQIILQIYIWKLLEQALQTEYISVVSISVG